jgi:hypothetical protein
MPKAQTLQETKSQLSVQLQGQKVAITAMGENPSRLRDRLVELGLSDPTVVGTIVSGWLPIESISEAARLSVLSEAFASLSTGSAGDVTTDGNPAMEVSEARLAHNVDGSSLKVGVVSDTYNRTFDFRDDADDDIDSGDLPPPSKLDILDDPSIENPKDEGRAMMQIIRDVAPGASLAFHTGKGGIGNMVEAIRDLAAAGSDIIVDDLGYFSSPFFQDGPIGSVADSVSSEGIPYFTSAGNFADRSYASPFSPDTIGTDTTGLTVYHNFGNEDTVDVRQDFYLPVGSSVQMVIQWTDPIDYVGAGNNPNTDIDAYVRDDTLGLQAFSIRSNESFPFEVIEFTNDGSIDANQDGNADVTFSLAFRLFEGPAPDRIKYAFPPSDYSPLQDPLESPTTWGQRNAQEAVSVAAARFSETPAFGTYPPEARAFSSRGGTPVFFDISGDRRPVPDIRGKPDLTAPDGADNTFFGEDTDGDGFPNFPGTSAAAPHVAGVAALMLDKSPDLTSSEVYEGLEESAIDMNTAGYDHKTGYGLVQATEATPLPVELARFEAAALSEGARLTWKVLSEWRSSGFKIQRRSSAEATKTDSAEIGLSKSSPGSLGWETIGTVESKAQSGEGRQGPFQYQFTDRNLPRSADSLQYRLRQVDLDGTESTAGTTWFYRPADELSLGPVYPNPAQKAARTTLTVPAQQNVSVGLFDTLGRKVRSVFEGTVRGRRTLQLDLTSLTSGIYFLRLSASGLRQGTGGLDSQTRRLTVVN